MIFQPRFSLPTLVALAWGGWSTTTTTSPLTFVQSQPLYSCSYPDAPISIHQDGSVLLEHYLNDDEGTFTIRLTYLDGYSWVGIGMNLEGSDKMVPALAIIGRLEQDGSGDLSVKRYTMFSDSKDGSGVQPLNDVNGHLRAGATFVQNEEGQSVLEFTHDIRILDESEDSSSSVIHTVTTDTVWVWAVGLADNVWEGKHKVHGSFSGLQFEDRCQIIETDPPTTAPPTESPTVSTTTATENPTMSARSPTVAEDGNSLEDLDVPTDVAESSPEATDQEDESPQEDESQEEEDDQDQQEETEEEDQAMQEVDAEQDGNIFEEKDQQEEGTTIIDSNTSGAGSSTENATSSGSEGLITGEEAGLSFAETDSSSTRSLWAAHGILLGIGWGIFAPLAIGVAYLRNNFTCLKKNALWLRLHFSLSMLVAICTVCGFFIAVAATNQEGDLHFKDDVHHKAGLAIFVLVTVQSIGGYFRPGLPKAKTAVTSIRQSTLFKSPSAIAEAESAEVITKEEALPKDETGTRSTPQTKSQLRQGWEYVHRFVGITLLGLSWYNCHSGIILQGEKYDEDDEQMLLNIFWAITGGIAGMIVLIGYVIRNEAK
jgi:hypothetical protein